ncbi:MAG: leucyl aminopeptidase [Candidatus Puniceispirillaceae bacterium]
MSFSLQISFISSANSMTPAFLMRDQDTVLGNAENADNAAICTLAHHAGFEAKSKTALTSALDNKPVLLVGLGELSLESIADMRAIGSSLYSRMGSAPTRQLCLVASGLSADMAAELALGAMLNSYEFNTYFTKKEQPETEAHLAICHPDAEAAEAAFDALMKLAKGIGFARDLVYEPANHLYPMAFAERCEALSELGLEVEILKEDKLAEMGMGALLGVGQGSVRDSAIVVMRWNGGGDEAPLALVGKGVCFDTGGISLKPPKGMEDMKWDMGGAAAVAGAMCALAGRGVKQNVIGFLGLVENMPDGNAQRPGDVVTSMSGQTIEVINTDAEGRLVLADVLTYAQQNYKPSAIVDFATLTGAIIVSLGKEYAGLFSNNDALASQLIAAGEKTAEKCWRMPIGEAYHGQLKSHIADMKNIGGPWGGSITAACFLEKFIENDTPWAHIDIAGKAWADKAQPGVPSGGTGFGVQLVNALIDDWQVPEAQS